MRPVLGGVDIGGTKCAVSLGLLREDGVDVLDKIKFPTPDTPQEALHQISSGMAELMIRNPEAELLAIGISCGGPLDSRSGLILSPPNLPNWDRIDCVTPLKEQFGVPVALQNDANACAVAEWKWGAGRGARNMVFLTFGTGMGAGLILDGRLYSGTNDMAGEVGHVRLEAEGPVGYGKAGSFEGFCSGGGIARLARARAEEAIARGESPLFCRTSDGLDAVTTQSVGEAAALNDPLAKAIFAEVGVKLGRGLAMLVDILNPERIVIGSIYGRQQALLEGPTLAELERESLPIARQVCQVVPAGLGEGVGDLACLSVALLALEA